MSKLYRGNWPHDKSNPPGFKNDDAVVVEMDKAHVWGPSCPMFHVAADLEDVERRLEEYVCQAAKGLLDAVVIAKVEGGEDLSGWPLVAVAKTKSFKCSLKLEYIDPATRRPSKSGRGKLEE